MKLIFKSIHIIYDEGLPIFKWVILYEEWHNIWFHLKEYRRMLKKL